MPERILIIGFGAAGRRFARVLRHLQETDPAGFQFAGICDTDPVARREAAPIAPTYADLDVAIRDSGAGVAIVAVNERFHAEVLTQLSSFPSLCVICEKPLTANLAEAHEMPEGVTLMPLTLNLVERQSPVLTDYFDWAASRSELRPLRVEFFWGKHRIADRRPTMGVLSEIAHPVDLIDFLFGIERLEVDHAHAISSDYSPHDPCCLDTVSFVARSGGCVVLGASSFAWPRRQRTLTALLADRTDALFRLTVDFDMPRWDCDHLSLGRIDPASGRIETFLERRTDNELFPPSLRGVAKLAGFVTDSIAVARNPGRPHRLVDFSRALRIQENLDVLEEAVATSVSHVVLGAREPGVV
jgi:predicted dehydrogenase